MIRTLSFDTSVNQLSIAIFENGKLVDSTLVKPEEKNRQETVTRLIPEIDRILRDNSWSRDSLTHLVVGVGPGSFTGVRIGVVTARTLAQALGLPLIGINRFQSISSTIENSSGIILDGGRNHLFLASYPCTNVLEEPLIAPFQCTISDLKEQLSEGRQWYCEAKIIDQVSKNSIKKLEKLRDLHNIAEIHGKILENQLNSSNDDSLEYPFERVKPLYLRGASITLKKNASKSQTSSSKKS